MSAKIYGDTIYAGYGYYPEGELYAGEIDYNAPIVDFIANNITPNPVGITGLGEEITFTNVSTDPNNRAILDGWYCDWTIEDGEYTVTYVNQVFNFSPTHSFHSAGYHKITLSLHWLDTINHQWIISTVDLYINQLEWSVSNGLTWPTPVYLYEEKTFTQTISGNVNYISNVTIVVDGTIAYENLTYNESFKVTFNYSDIHTVQQNIYYNNGFEDKIQSETFDVILSPTADFDESDDACGFIYTSTAEPGKYPITMYRWYVFLNNSLVATLTGPYDNIFRYNWSSLGEYKIKHEITDVLGQTASITKTYPVSTCHIGSAMPQGGMAGGGVVIKERPLPTLRIKLIKEKKEQIIINVLPTKI